MLVPYQWDGEENCCDVGGWGGQILWEADVLEDLYGEKNESDLTKTQNSQVINEQKKLVATVHINQFLRVRRKANAGR